MRMAMPIRFKFFIVLLAFSLGPMFLSRSLMGRTVYRMSQDLAGATREELLQIVTAELEHNAATMLSELDARAQGMILGTAMLARETTTSLARPLDPTAPLSLPAIDARHAQLPPDAAPYGDYVRQTMMGKAAPIRVSLESATFHAVGGEPAPDDRVQMTRLRAVLPTLRRVYRTLGDDSVWLNIALESGVLMTYPGHDELPPMYDPRKQDWYRRARETGRDYAWTTPWIDPATKRAVATVACPIRDGSGRFIGAASIDVPNASVLDDSALASRWSEGIRSYMVTRQLNGETLEEGLLVLAQRAYDEKGHHRRMEGIEVEWFLGDQPETVTRLLRAMNEKRVGHLQIEHDGQPSVLSWASNANFSFLLCAPESVVSKLPDHLADQMNGAFAQMRRISAGVAGAILVVVGLIAWFGSRAITGTMLRMVATVKRLAGGDFSARFDYRTGDERDALIDAFNEMGPKLHEHLMLRRDMELAQEVQNLLLPRTEPDLAGFDMAGRIDFCDQTGGDYYDFIPVPDGRGQGLDVILGDVSGHGVPSALVMATARGQLHSLAGAPMAAEERIRTVNNVLSRDLDGTGRFLTLFYLHLTGGSGRVRWVRAGHDPAVRFDPATGAFGELGGSGLAMGVLEGYAYESHEAELVPGEVVVMATDGVWEARNADGEMFGKQRMLAIIRESAHKCALEIRDAIMSAVDEFQDGQQDDIAVVVVKRLRD
ncbi:MAG: SpoIIE family protein phosphatase [Pseudodesulfovibrio sp.]